jgi:hypothetical protein
MKKKLLLGLLVAIYSLPLEIFGQATNLGNVRIPNSFLGWDGTGPNPGFLEVRNDFDFPIRFATGTSQNERLRLWQKQFGALMLPGMPTSQQNPYPGTRLTRNAMPVDGLIPIGVPLSLLHLGYQWPVNLQTQGIQGGFRDWMNIGTMYMEGTDNFYVGLREKLGPALDPTGRTSTVIAGQSDDQDAVISWGDNSQTPILSPNNLTFIFGSTRSQTLQGFQYTNYGREVARMIPEGFMGIGPVFFDNAQPQNLLHVNNSTTLQAYVQISNAGNTGQTITDGFHLGITPGTGVGGGIAELNQFEDRDMMFFTNNTFRMVIKDNSNGFGRVGINTNIPGNRLTISSSTADPGAGNVAIPGGSSGIRTRNMTAVTPTIANPGLGVVSVDSMGDFIYVPGGTGGALGNICGNTQNPLTADYEIPLNQHNFYFSGSQLNGDRVAVGIPCNTALLAKFNSLLNQTYNTSFITGNNAGYFLNVNGAAAHNVGVKGEVTSGGGDNTGGFFMCTSGSANSSNNGVYAQSFGSPNTNRGGFFRGLGGNDAIGLTATAAGGANTTYAGVFNGDVLINGVLTVNASDQNLKTNISTIPNAMQIISQLYPKQFYFDTLNTNGVQLSSKKQYGLIAQQTETLLPEVVSNTTKPAEYDQNGNLVHAPYTYKTMNYDAFIGILIAGIQEQKNTIDSMRTVLNTINNTLASCCSGGTARSTGIGGNDPKALTMINVNLSDVDVIVLNQNVPNPFAEQTTITYNVPEKYNFAQLVFKTVEGKIIRTVDITKKGRGQVNVFANDLSNGLYTYSLIVDGTTVDTKKMVKQN